MSREFLKIKNFNLKAKAYEFEDVHYMAASEKTKIYKTFVSFLNNHFKESNFKKALYEHFHLHCGFIAHYNIKGFYSEYFNTAANFQKIAFNYSSDPSEYGCYVNETYQGKDSLSAKQAFYKIYEELNSSRTGLGEFYSAIVDGGRYAYSGDYCDLNRAIAESFSEYMETWRELIKSAIKDEHKQQKAKAVTVEVAKEKIDDFTTNSEINIKKVTNIEFKQTSLFDFM